MEPSVEPGGDIDGFRVAERVHAGGMGVLYRVTGRGVDFPMVMKVPRLGHGEPGETIVTYEVEATVLAALEGPHVPRFVAAGDLSAQPYIVMEWIEGRSLSEWTGRGPLEVDEVRRVGGALATALHALHLQETIHLDVKPSNVIIRPGGEAVLIDFGLAHHAHYPDLLAEEFRHPIGSGPYISPEQVLGVRSDPRSDVFSLGVVLYQLATGRLPFGSPTTPAGLRKRLFRDPLPPRAIDDGVPEWLQEIVLRCLEPGAGDRYASAAQVAFDLANPDCVAVGARGRRRHRLAGLGALLRWIRGAGLEAAPPLKPSTQLSAAPIVLAAVATAHGNEAQSEALRTAVRRVLAEGAETRLACVTVMKPTPELGGSDAAETAARQRLKQLVLLRHWADPLALPAGRVSFHALEGGDPAAALLEYVRANGVDHVIIGGPPPDLPLKGVLGTVATKVALGAPCTVTVVRARRR